MSKFWLVCLGYLLFPAHVIAIDLTIKDPIVANLEITLNASLSASSNYYLQGTLRSQSSSKYFGETQNNKSDWIDYISSPEKEYITSNFFVTDVKNATWSGTLKLRYKTDDPNYLGPGTYDLKLRRFTGNSSSSAGESNTLSVNLTGIIPTPTPSPSPSPSPSPTSPPTPTPTPRPSPIPSLSPSIYPLASVSTGTVAGESTEINLSGFGISPSPSLQGQSSQVPTLNKSRAKTALLAGSGLILISLASFFGYRKYLKSIIISE